MSSKLDKSVIVAGAGLVASIFTLLVKKVYEVGGTDEDVHRLATPGGEAILSKVADLIVTTKRQAFKVLVDCTKSLAEMVSAGKYNWVNNDITQDHFPISGQDQKEVEVILFHFNRAISSEDAISEMGKVGFRPATIEELLALGVSQPELQKQFPIVALGSVWQHPSGHHYVPFLGWAVVGRSLDLFWFDYGWCKNLGYRFVVLRKS